MIGQFVTSKAGHDKGCLYVVVAQEADFVFLCDGKQKKPEAPKKKRRKHIQPINAWVEKELLHRLQKGEKDAPFIRSERHASDKAILS